MPLIDALSRFLVAVFLLVPGMVAANDWNALKEPGTIAIMRHALAPGTGDPANFELGDCSTQRNLNDAGRDQARAIGAALRDHNITFDAVLSSQWCRTMETAHLLGLGPVTEAPSLNSFFRDSSSRDSQTEATRDLITETPRRLMLVTHQVNISALVGHGTRSGEVLIIRPTDSGIELMGRILIDP
jgi:phosphohistidine phosphatase SixA